MIVKAYNISPPENWKLFLENNLFRDNIENNWVRLDPFILPPCFYALRTGTQVSEGELTFVKQFFRNPEYLIERREDIGMMTDIKPWISGKQMIWHTGTLEDWFEVKKTFCQNLEESYNFGIGILGLVLGLGLAFWKTLEFFPASVAIIAFSTTITWHFFRRIESLAFLDPWIIGIAAHDPRKNYSKDHPMSLSRSNKIGFFSLLFGVFLLLGSNLTF